MLGLNALDVGTACLRAKRPCSALFYMDMFCDNDFGGSGGFLEKVGGFVEGGGVGRGREGARDSSGFGRKRAGAESERAKRASLVTDECERLIPSCSCASLKLHFAPSSLGAAGKSTTNSILALQVSLKDAFRELGEMDGVNGVDICDINCGGGGGDAHINTVNSLVSNDAALQGVGLKEQTSASHLEVARNLKATGLTHVLNSYLKSAMGWSHSLGEEVSEPPCDLASELNCLPFLHLTHKHTNTQTHKNIIQLY